MIIYTVRVYSRKSELACGITKKGKESPANGHNYEFFPPTFPNLGHLECYTFPKWQMVLKAFTENKFFISQKGYYMQVPYAVSG